MKGIDSFRMAMLIPMLAMLLIGLGIIQYGLIELPAIISACNEVGGVPIAGYTPSTLLINETTYARCIVVENGTEATKAVQISKTWIG